MREEQELLQVSLAERHKRAVGRYHAQCELRRSLIKQAGYVRLQTPPIPRPLTRALWLHVNLSSWCETLGTRHVYNNIMYLYVNMTQFLQIVHDMFFIHSDVEAKRLAECKLRSEMMDSELTQWREEVDAYQRHSMNKAEETAQVWILLVHLSMKLWVLES